MIAYHPAFDPYHTAFRLVRLLSAAPNGYERDKARILDFHLVFPQAVQYLTLPQDLVSWRRQSKAVDNPYWFTGDRWMVFARMGPFFAAATSLLYGSHILDRASHDKDYLLLDLTQEATRTLVAIATAKNRLEGDLMAFLVRGLGEIPFSGADGLKHRSRLMEFKYDAV